jgi:hypothetical protein
MRPYANLTGAGRRARPFCFFVWPGKLPIDDWKKLSVVSCSSGLRMSGN